MRCHYEILGVSKDVSDDDLKKAYRKLALKWHPDKNPDDPHKAKEQFQLVQQAWEVLSDPHERAWYDNHREAILKGGTEEYSIDIFQYFSATCFKGYGDDEKGFYAVYRSVFDNIAAEDAEFARESKFNEEIPSFGNSQSSYEQIVHNFYSYWQSYSTKRSFSWLEPYDTHDAPNRRVSRLIEKENKKVRDKAKRERNEQVRNLVAFVRKRDKRVHAHAAKLAERNRENYRKTEERKKAQLLERQKLLRGHNECDWLKLSNMEAELKNIEANLAEEFGEELSSDSDIKSDNEVDDNTLYCIACNKIFKTHKAFTNHENSKKHKDNIITLKTAMVKEDEDFRDSSEESQSNESSSVNEQSNLAIDSQMPDFLLNFSQNNLTNVDNENNGDISDGELISDTEENPRHSRLRSKKKKLDKENISLATDPQMDEDIPFSVKTENKNDDITSEDELISDQEEDISLDRQKKKKKRKRNIQNPNPVFEHISDNATKSINEETWLSKKQRKKLQQKKAAMSKYNKDTCDEEKQEIKDENETAVLMAENIEGTSAINSADILEANVINENIKTNKAKKGRRKEAEDKKTNIKDLIADTDNSSICCVSCKTEFPSKNKLFEHLKKTGHAVYIPETSKSKKNQEKTQKRKTASEKKTR